MKTVEQQLAIEAVSSRYAGKFAVASNAGMLARYRSSHLESITDVLNFSRE